jgi:hypothetical protein
MPKFGPDHKGGRPRGSTNKSTARVYHATRAELEKLGGKKGYEHLYFLLNDPDTPELIKRQIAEVMLPYELPRLTATVVQAQIETTTAPPAPDQDKARDELLKILANRDEPRALANIQPVDPKEDRPTVADVGEPKAKPQGKVEEAQLLPVPFKIAERRFEPAPDPIPPPRRPSVTEGPGSTIQCFWRACRPSALLCDRRWRHHLGRFVCEV